ncbi:glycoside hydrolase family 5 protein [Stutzerimonas azotifigens]|uniref:glycoside hydrolase family 5 protein n=1 Tax=Stutzerimonas azotifigens TaxID=291995 RepID=UPI0003F7016F|nr:glycoside hydrolase family 5 protein [Stutzerimonas azotifigens]
MTMNIQKRTARAATIALGLAAALAGASAFAADQPDGSRGIPLVGINMSGAGFAPEVLPGKNGTNYFYPEKRHFTYYRQKGITLIRFPFIWERVQHDLGARLDFEQIRLLKRTLDYAHQNGQQVILDMHNYGRYKDQLIGSSAVPYSAYAEVWRELAETFKDHPALHGYDIMNEPHGTVGLWPGAAQAAVDAIREVDRETLIFVEGERWSSAYHWPQVNANLLIKDPSNRIVYEGHLYFDPDFSGRYQKGNPDEVDPMLGVERARPFVEWLKRHGQKGFLGEYGVPGDSPAMLQAMDNMLQYLNENCIPSAYWAGGPGWNNYALSVEPRADGADRPQLAILQKHLDNDCTEYGPTPDASGDGAASAPATQPQE